jgi:hypothetical protein
LRRRLLAKPRFENRRHPRIFADEAAKVGGVPALALLLQARRRVEQAAVVGEGGDDAGRISQAVRAERRRHPAELGVVERLPDVRRVVC